MLNMTVSSNRTAHTESFLIFCCFEDPPNKVLIVGPVLKLANVACYATSM